jgi:hypothetical protein
MEQEGEWQDEQGALHTGLIKVRHHVQNTYAYILNVPVVQGLLAQLPEQSPYGPRPKTSLGRPRKNHPKINGLKTNDIPLNGLKTDGISEIPSKNTRNNGEIPSKNKRSFYTQISNYTDFSNTQIGGDEANASHPHRTLVSHPDENSSHEEIGAYSEQAEAVTSSYSLKRQQAKTRVSQDIGNPAQVDTSGEALSSEQASATGQQTAASKKGAKRQSRKKEVPADLFASLDPVVQAVIVEWQSIFKRPVPVTDTLIKHATTLAAFEPAPGEIAHCRLWMYATDRKQWYSSHGMHLGDVVREFERFRSLADVPQATQQSDDLSWLPSGVRLSERWLAKHGGISSFDDPDYDSSGEFYPEAREASYAAQ